MLSSRISVPLPAAPDAEDLFSSALSSLFTDDTQNSHGTPGSSVTYHSPRFGDIHLCIPAHPDVEEGRKLFAHYLWNAGVIAADAIEVASQDQEEIGDQDEERSQCLWDARFWDVRGKRVLELGAGTALPSLISALSGAAVTTITDHPSSPALTTGAIEQNVRDNVFEKTEQAQKPMPTATQRDLRPKPVVDAFGYTWGTTNMYLPSQYCKPTPQQLGTFDRIIIADCLWMASQHVNLVKTILAYLSLPPLSSCSRSEDSCALVVAGFYTGRSIVRHFFQVATGEWKDQDQESTGNSHGTEEEREDQELSSVQGRLKAVEIFEVDVNGTRRPWVPVRLGENKEQAKRWCVCAVLVKR